MAIITTGAFAKALWPGVNAWYGKAYTEYPTEYTQLFDSFKSGQNYEEDMGISSFGLASIKTQSDGIVYDTEQQGYLTRYQHSVYALGFVISREMVEDDLYGVVGKNKAQSLAFSMRQTKETVAANVYNRAFNSTYKGGDSLELCSAVHTNVAGGTWQNKLSTDADLSEAALEEACIDIAKWKNDRGLKIAVQPQCIIIPVDLQFEAERILKTPYRVDTANNDISAINHMSILPGGIKVNHYLTDTDAWFLRTNTPHGMKHFQRRALQFAVDNEFDTENAKFKATERYIFGWTDPRGLYGSQGA
jgi:hypothetical protein